MKGLIESVRRRSAAIVRELTGPDATELILRLTLVLLLLRPPTHWTSFPLVVAAASIGLLSRTALASPMTWLVLTIATGWAVVHDWPHADNHHYLLAYWCLSVFLALLSTAPKEAMAHSGRLLIGLAFAFAVLWKGVLSPDYLDGRFFRVRLQTDGRFAAATKLIGGLSDEVYDNNRVILGPDLPSSPDSGTDWEDFAAARLEADYSSVAHKESTGRVSTSLALPGPAPTAYRETQRFAWFWKASTWYVLLIEAAIAATFLIPLRALAGFRDSLLLLFAVSIYAFAPVDGFGWLLLIMGLAQAPELKKVRLAYVVTFILVAFLAAVPWSERLLILVRT